MVFSVTIPRAYYYTRGLDTQENALIGLIPSVYPLTRLDILDTGSGNDVPYIDSGLILHIDTY
jgi:hypothetical protein